MPELTRWLTSGSIDVDRLEGGFAVFRSYCGERSVPERRRLRIIRPHERWEFEELDEFLGELRRGSASAELVEEHDRCVFRLEPNGRGTTVTLRMPSRRALEDVLGALGVEDRDDSQSFPSDFKVFLGHGRNTQWLVLADHLRRRHGLAVATYETAASVGQPAMDVLAQLAAEVSFALLLHTAEVLGEGDIHHAGANVIHETGYFQARLGVSRALILREETCHPFTNVAGLTELRFRTGAVQEVFGDVIAILRLVSSRN
jgi:hypothetical protein